MSHNAKRNSHPSVPGAERRLNPERNSPRTRARPRIGSQIAKIRGDASRGFSCAYKSYVTKCTGNRILGTLFVIATNECRKAPLHVWMTRTRSAC